MSRRRLFWALFDRLPTATQDWVESYARTLIVRRSRQYQAELDRQRPWETRQGRGA